MNFVMGLTRWYVKRCISSTSAVKSIILEIANPRTVVTSAANMKTFILMYVRLNACIDVTKKFNLYLFEKMSSVIYQLVMEYRGRQSAISGGNARWLSNKISYDHMMTI